MKVHLARLFGFAMVIAGPGTALAQYSNQLPQPLAQAVQLEPANTEKPMVSLVDIPSGYVQAVSLKLEVMYRDVEGVHLSPDVRSGKLIVMAPPALQGRIQAEATQLLFDEMQPTVAQAGATQVGSDGRYQVRLAAITWREFEDSLAKLVGKQLPVTTSRNGEQARFQLTGAPLDGSVIDIDRRENTVTVVAPGPTMPGWQSMIKSLDQMPQQPGHVTEMVKLVNARQSSIQQAIRMLDSLKTGEDAVVVPTQKGMPFRPTAFQAAAAQNPAGQAPSAQPTQPLPLPPGQAVPTPENSIGVADEGTGIIGETQIQFVPQLGIFIVRGAKKDVQRVLEVIEQIEKQSVITQPVVEVHSLKNLNSAATAELLTKLYTDVLSARQGDVSITALDNPNALLLIGRQEAVVAAKTLVEKIDIPSDSTSQLRVFRLENTSAVDAEETINNFFVDRPGEGDDLRPGLGVRVRVVSDYRSNSLIVSASQRDMLEVSRLVSEIDVQGTTAQNEIRVFPLKNSLAEDLAPVLQTAINGTGDAETDENSTRPSTSLSIVALDSDRGGVLDSGILAHVVVTADVNANAVVVRAPSSSMSLIGELIRQLDQVPGAETVVKVFTVKNGDALKLTTSLQALFGGGTNSTANGQVGAGNIAGLATATASPNSSLVGLTFTTDQRTNSIIASGSANDLEVVESVLLRLDTEGFAERITEVVWLRHQSAPEIATAITSYVQQRTQSVTRVQQYQQGLGPFDLADRDLIVVAEVISNSLILSVSPRLYDEVRRLIDNLDRRPPMVLIKVVLAEISLGDQFELGGQIGLQDSLLFDRSLAANGTIPTTTNNSSNGFNFNQNGTPNNSVVDPNTVGSRALSTFGLGTQSSQLGYGGFVLSAASDSFNLLFRALQDANRAQILSRPQIMTVDNKAGFVQVGQRVARVSGIVNNGLNTQIVPTDIDVGLILEVLPRVGADGLISMQIRAERSAINQSQPGTSIGTDTNGNAITIPNIDTTNAETTITAYSGQTVVFGGLIQKQRNNQSRRVPYLSDIPLLGVMFRFDRETEQRSELLIIMTPMLITGDEDLEYVKQMESSRMSYCLADVVEMHGDVGLNPGYGLWGPAVGPVIYPDLQPTIDQFPTQSSMQNGSGEVILNERIISEQPLNQGAVESDGTMLNGPTPVPAPMEPSAIEQVPAPELPSVIEDGAPDSGLTPPSVPAPRSGNRPVPKDNRLTAQPASPAIRRASATGPSGAPRTAQPPVSPGVKPADFKFIDGQTAASMSGIAR